MTHFAYSVLRLDSCTVFRQSTVAKASLHLLYDLSRIEKPVEMMLSRFSSTGCRIQPFYRNTSLMPLQLFPFPPTSDQAHSRKRKVAEIPTEDNIQKARFRAEAGFGVDVFPIALI